LDTVVRARHPSPLVGALTGAALVAAITVALVPFRADVSAATPGMLLVAPVVAAGLLGGRRPALLTAVLAASAYDVAFITPYWTPKIDRVDEVVALVVFSLLALVVGRLVALESERRSAAEDRALELQNAYDELARLQEDRERLAEEATRAAVLERVDEQRASLLRSVSHDLRTPLATIRAVTSDLRAGTQYDDATRDDLLDLVGDEAERLDRLVANLLSLSRIEAGALQPERQAVAVDELVGECVRRLGRLFLTTRLEVSLPPERLLVDFDYSQLDQVLSNLLENAARHAPMGSIVRVGARRDGESVELFVDDEGPGVGAFERELIFLPFRRGYGSTSSGIGLAICKALVDANGGAIAVSTSAGGGARFTVTMPVRDAAPAESNDSAVPSARAPTNER
jgi:two-component system sensor histidine kinase KdpD